MILTRAEFWDQLKVATIDLFAPVLAVSTRTGGGQVIRARSFGDDLWTASVTLQRDFHADVRRRRALLMLAQQPGNRFIADDPSYLGSSHAGGVLQAVASDNRTLTLSGMNGTVLNVGDYIEVGGHFHTVTTAGSSSVKVMPHVRPSMPIGQPVILRDPGFLAVIDTIRPATLDAISMGETSFTITQVYE